MHITLRMTIMLSIVGAFKRRWRLNIKVKEWPFAEGSRDNSCARAFYFENIETILSTVVVLHMCHA